MGMEAEAAKEMPPMWTKVATRLESTGGELSNLQNFVERTALPWYCTVFPLRYDSVVIQYTNITLVYR